MEGGLLRNDEQISRIQTLRKAAAVQEPAELRIKENVMDTHLMQYISTIQSVNLYFISTGMSLCLTQLELQ